MRLFRRSKLILRTNYFGAQDRYAVGAIVDLDGQRWRVTKHEVFMTTPQETIRVYGVPA